MLRNLATYSAVFRNHKGSVVFLNLQRTEVIVHAAHISASLVEPAAGVVHRSCGIRFLDNFCNPKRVKLAPPLIEGNPQTHTGVVIQLPDHADDISLEPQPGLLIFPGKKLVMVVAQDSSCRGNDRRQIGFQK